MKKNFSNTKTMRLVLSVCFALGGFCAQDSNLYAQPASGCKLASQTVILPCTEVANLNGLVIPSNFFKEACNGGAVLSVTTKTSDTGASYADVKGIIRSVDPDAPNIEWEILLPMKWNGRSLQLGGGANNGSIPNVHGTSAFGSVKPIDAGYVVYGDDSGHQSSSGMDASFASNEESLNNYIRQHLIKAHDVMRYVGSRSLTSCLQKF